MDRYPVLTAGRPARPDAPPPAPRARWSPWLMALGLASLATSVVIVAVTLGQGPGGEPPAAPSDSPERRAVAVAYVDVEGGVRPLFPVAPGRVIEAPVPEGKEVEEGTVLLRIDDALAKAKLRAARYELQAAEEKLVQARKLVPQHEKSVESQKSAVAAARLNLAAMVSLRDRAKRLYDTNVGGSKEELDAANSKVEGANEEIRGAQALLDRSMLLDPKSAVRLAETDVAGKKEAVEAAQLLVDQCRIPAPCKGVILRRLVNVGEMLGPTRTRPAIEFCPSGDRIVRAEVEQEFAGRLRVGQKVHISDDITGAGDWNGEVSRISDWYTQRRAVLLEPMQYNDVRTLEVIIRLKHDPKNALRINQRVRVKLDGAD
jgi:multidrug resistance efflux pump